MSECLVIPPSIINDTVVALSKDRMCTVFWNEQTKLFESADGTVQSGCQPQVGEVS